ncbi:hypothetical protein EJB05_56006, partial [Eragrostis curvula]
MSGKGKRRSARLLKLEEQKNDDDSTVCLLDPWQIIRNSISGSSARGKRKRNEEHQQSQGEASCSHQPLPAAATDNLSSQSSVGQIIEYILDELEMRDKHELFAMPDDIQVADYAERVNRPGDFATLRQKNKDGMYTALEHFENDVYMVFQKAMTMNSQDTVPFREAMSLLEQAKHVFMSLKSNQMYSESELAAWRQRHLDQLQHPIPPARREGDMGVPSSHHPPPTPAQRPPATPRKKATAERKVQENTKNVGRELENQRARQPGGKEANRVTPPVKKIRKGIKPAVSDLLFQTLKCNRDVARSTLVQPLTTPAWRCGGGSRTLTKQEAIKRGRRWRCRPSKAGTSPFKIWCLVRVVQQPQEHTYRESLQRFVRHAGLKARVAAEFRTLECVARARHSPAPPHYWNPGAAGFLPPHGYHHHHPTPPPDGNNDPALRAPPPSSSADQARPPVCKLETDELLKLFVLMGTPGAFLERAKQMFGDDKRKEKCGVTKGGRNKAKAPDHVTTNKAADHTKAKAADDVRAGAMVVAKAADHAKAGATAAKAANNAKTGSMAAKTADRARKGAMAAKAADNARASAAASKAAKNATPGAVAAKEPGQKSDASEPAAAAYGPFAAPKLLPGRLGFGQFASSPSQPFKVKPSTPSAAGKKKIS